MPARVQWLQSAVEALKNGVSWALTLRPSNHGMTDLLLVLIEMWLHLIPLPFKLAVEPWVRKGICDQILFKEPCEMKFMGPRKRVDRQAWLERRGVG